MASVDRIMLYGDRIVYAVECTEYVAERIDYEFSIHNMSGTGLFMC